jgi:hypothetical protein
MRKDEASACVAMAAALRFQSGMDRTGGSVDLLDWRFSFSNGGRHEEHTSADRAMASLTWAYLVRVWHGETEEAGANLARMVRRETLALTTGELMQALRLRAGYATSKELARAAGNLVTGQTLQRFERGSATGDAAWRVPVAKLLGVTPKVLTPTKAELAPKQAQEGIPGECILPAKRTLGPDAAHGGPNRRSSPTGQIRRAA